MKTYLDSGVVLAAWRGDRPDSRIALGLMDASQRQLYSSQLVRLELVPKPVYFKRQAEVAFYDWYFSIVEKEEVLNRDLWGDAFEMAKKYGLAAVDGLHVAAAIRCGAEEFITTERPEKPMFRVRELTVRHLDSVND